MSWLIKISSTPKMRELSDEELNHLRTIGLEGISYLQMLSNKFSKASFQTTLRQYDMIYTFGPKIAFMMLYEDISSQFYDFANFSTPSGIQIKGYTKRSGYDKNTYHWLNGEWIGFNGNKWPWNNFESSKNLIGLVKWNLLYVGVDTELAWRKHSKDPKVRSVLESIDQYDVSVKDGEQLLLERLRPGYDIDAFLNAYKNWWWNRKPEDERFNAIIDTFKEENSKDNEDKYVYNISMDPQKEGHGKFIDFDLIEQAFEIYGDFNVVVQYYAGRNIYSASDILNHRKTNNDRSFQFFNRNGGIRQMWIK